MKRGLSVAELIVAIVISFIAIGAIYSLLFTGIKSVDTTKRIGDVKELSKSGFAVLDWVFQRWGSGVPCNDPYSTPGDCTPIRDCNVNISDPFNSPYPPPSSRCVTVVQKDPCDEVWFYANLKGFGFVERLKSPHRVSLFSCRLQIQENGNAIALFHIKEGGLWFRDIDNDSKVLIFRLSDLSPQNADCININTTSNAEADREAKAINGLLLDTDGNPTDTLLLEGGHLIIRIPYLVRLYCRQRRGENWLYMIWYDVRCFQTLDIPDKYQKKGCNPRPEPLIPVSSFKVINVNTLQTDNYLRVRMTVQKSESVLIKQGTATLTIERIFGR